jgi:hypothetical protein
LSESFRKIQFKKNQFSNKEIVKAVSKPIKHRRVKTRNFNFKNITQKLGDSKGRETTQKVYVFDKNHSCMQKMLHKRSGTSFVGESLSVSNSNSLMVKSKFSKNKDQMKLSKDLIKRFKRKSESYNNEQRKSSLEQSRSYKLSSKNDLENTSKPLKSKKFKDFPLPVSSTNKKLRKAIEARLK